MARWVKLAAAQMGPNQESSPRVAIIDRMLKLMDQAIEEQVEILVYPELALTTYFPKRVRDDYDQFFESEMPNASVQRLFDKARKAGIAFHLGYAEKSEGKRFNTVIYVDEQGKILNKYRKLHIPGAAKVDPEGYAKVFEVHYFDPGDTGFNAFQAKQAKIGMFICQDRRYPESYRVLGLQGAEIILQGYNTTLEPMALALNELVLRAGAYQNSLFVVGVAKAGVEDGVELIGGSCIIDPQGEVIAKGSSNGDELVAARINLDQIIPMRKRWNFYGRRRPEYYGLITEPVKTPVLLTPK
jgi:predicted amidohydrolase